MRMLRLVARSRCLRRRSCMRRPPVHCPGPVPTRRQSRRAVPGSHRRGDRPARRGCRGLAAPRSDRIPLLSSRKRASNGRFSCAQRKMTPSSVHVGLAEVWFGVGHREVVESSARLAARLMTSAPCCWWAALELVPVQAVISVVGTPVASLTRLRGMPGQARSVACVRREGHSTGTSTGSLSRQPRALICPYMLFARPGEIRCSPSARFTMAMSDTPNRALRRM